MDRVFIIAEAGINHNGSIKIAKKMIDVAIMAGADAIKFQTFRAERLVIENTPQFKMLKKLELSFSDYKELFFYCRKKNIMFMSAPFDEESVDFLDKLGMRTFKIASGEVTNKPLIQHIASKRKAIILSTGMSYLEEVERSMDWINEVWERLTIRPQLTLLHCVSNYPAKAEDINLLAMKTLEYAFHIPVGISDHTQGIEIPCAAVAMGAKVVEKHFTLDRNMAGPDHKASIEPDELRRMVSAIRNVEKAFGDGIKRPTPQELKNRIMTRKSIVASVNIYEGEYFTENNITVKRPGTGVSPIEWDRVIVKKAKKDFKKDELIEV